MQNVPFLEQSNSSKVAVERLLSKHNNGEYERIQMCTNITKINRKNKKQQRLFIITDQAIYNIKAKIIKRHIHLSEIAAVTKSSLSTEFAINIPSEYDYRFDAGTQELQNKIISCIARAVTDLKQEIFIHTINQPAVDKWTVTKSDIKSVEQCADSSARTVLAVLHLEKMGFKTKPARLSLKQHDNSLSRSMQSLVIDYAKELESNKGAQSPFRSPIMSPVSILKKKASFSPTFSPRSNHLSPTPSFTEEVDDVFPLVI